MNLHLSEIAERLQLSIGVVRIYLCRAEFSHIFRRQGMYYGITQKDLNRIKELYIGRKWYMKNANNNKTL